MNTKHTQGPWQVDNGYLCHGDEAVADMNLMPSTQANEMAANAAFIVRACNSHDDLVRLVEKIYNADRTGNNGAYMGEASLCRAFALEAQAILAKAKGEA